MRRGAEPQRPAHPTGKQQLLPAFVEPGGRHRDDQSLERVGGASPRLLGEREDQLGVDGHAGLGTRDAVGCEELVVIGDRAVVDPDDRSVPDRVVVGQDTRMALCVVPDVHEELCSGLGHLDAVEELARARALLVHHDLRVAAVGEAHRVRPALGDACEQCAGGHRPIDGALEREAVSGDPAHDPIYRAGLSVTGGGGRWSVPGRGKATAQETISPEGSATGFSLASREESSLRRVVVVIALITCRSGERGPAFAGPLCVEPWPYARTKPFLWTMTSPSVILGGLGSAVSSFSSRTQVVATRVDSSACAEVSKKSMELMTPLSASMR